MDRDAPADCRRDRHVDRGGRVGCTVDRPGVGHAEQRADSRRDCRRHLPVRFKLDTKGPVDMATLRVTVAPGGTSGWHSHGGAVVVTVVSGTATLYEASRTGCAREVVPAGQAFWEAANLPSHVLVNEGTEPTVVYATFFLADRAAPIIDEPRPPVCAGIG